MLLVAMNVSNDSNVLFRHKSSTCTLMDASRRNSEGGVVLIPFAKQDPLVPVYWEETDDPDEVAKGNLFAEPPEQIELEPGEAVETELAFPLDEAVMDLLAIRVLIEGSQGRFRRKKWVWSSFWFVPPQAQVSEETRDTIEEK